MLVGFRIPNWGWEPRARIYVLGFVVHAPRWLKIYVRRKGGGPYWARQCEQFIVIFYSLTMEIFCLWTPTNLRPSVNEEVSQRFCVESREKRHRRGERLSLAHFYIPFINSLQLFFGVLGGFFASWSASSRQESRQDTLKIDSNLRASASFPSL